MKKLISIVVVLVFILSLIPATGVLASGDTGNNGYCDSAVNDPPITVGDDWSATSAVPPAFFWYGTVGTPEPSASDPFTFSYAGVVRVDVTDDFQKGDQFRVYDDGSIIGDTSSVAVDAAGTEIGPEAAFNDPTYSSGSFYLGPGDHSIEIVTITNPFGSGRGYIRVMPIVEFTKEITDYIPGGDGDEVVEVGEDDWEWDLTTTIRNVSGETIHIGKVHDRIGGDLESDWEAYTAVLGPLDMYTRGKTQKVFYDFEGDFDLADGQTVFFRIWVSPDINTGTGNGKKPGHPEFTSTGEHCLNSGSWFEGWIGDDYIEASTMPICVEVEEFVDNS
jgi:hypothetical protein